MDADPGRAKPGDIPPNRGNLRSLIPTLLANELFYDRLLNWAKDWNRFQDILSKTNISLGAIGAIWDVFEEELKKMQREKEQSQQIEEDQMKKKLEFAATDESEKVFGRDRHSKTFIWRHQFLISHRSNLFFKDRF